MQASKSVAKQEVRLISSSSLPLRSLTRSLTHSLTRSDIISTFAIKEAKDSRQENAATKCERREAGNMHSNAHSNFFPVKSKRRISLPFSADSQTLDCATETPATTQATEQPFLRTYTHSLTLNKVTQKRGSCLSRRDPHTRDPRHASSPPPLLPSSPSFLASLLFSCCV